MKNLKKLQTKADLAYSQGWYLNALRLYSELLEEFPNDEKLLTRRGECNLRVENFTAGLQDFAKLVQINNKNITALGNFGIALMRTNKINDAKEILEYALEVNPNNYDTYINLGTVYQALEKPEQALQTALKAIEINFKGYMAYNNLGSALSDLRMIKEAREAFMTASALNPKYVTTIINLAQLEVKSGNNRKGIELYENALNLENITPGEIDLVKYYLSYSYLYEGNLVKGWNYYDYGFSSLIPPGAKRSNRKFSQPQWNGENIGEKTLLIWREQGLGDEMEFSSCFQDLVADSRVGRVIVECDARLISMFKRTYPAIEFRPEQLDSGGHPLQGDFDFHCAVGSLPKIYRNTIVDFQEKKLKLNISTDYRNEFKERLRDYRQKKLVGICWRSGKLQLSRNTNYTTLDDWESLLKQENLQFVNLQYGDCEQELYEIENKLNIKILRWPDIDLKNNLEAVIALCGVLDYVVTVGTAVTALAGYSGVDTFLMSHKSWIMLGQNDFLPWCPNVKLIVAEDEMPVAVCLDKVQELIANTS